MSSFYDFQLRQPQTTLQMEQVIDKIEEMCQVLRTNYQSYAIQCHRNSLAKNAGVDEFLVKHHTEQIDKLAMGEGVDQFSYEKGRKYAKIIHINGSGQRSAHAFVDLKTGDVYKSASWSKPALGIRYNLLDNKSREEMYRRADWAGAYLYR